MMAREAIAVLNQMKIQYGLQWGVSPEFGCIRVCYPHQTIATFVHDPIEQVGNRLDYFGIKWKLHKADDGWGWLIVEWPPERLLRWINTYIKSNGHVMLQM